MSPFALVSAGMAPMRTVKTPRGSLFWLIGKPVPRNLLSAS
jgi:hypothetical protein